MEIEMGMGKVMELEIGTEMEVGMGLDMELGTEMKVGMGIEMEVEMGTRRLPWGLHHRAMLGWAPGARGRTAVGPQLCSPHTGCTWPSAAAGPVLWARTPLGQTRLRPRGLTRLCSTAGRGWGLRPPKGAALGRPWAAGTNGLEKGLGWTCWRAALQRGTGSAGGRQVDHEPAACPGCQEDQWDARRSCPSGQKPPPQWTIGKQQHGRRKPVWTQWGCVGGLLGAGWDSWDTRVTPPLVGASPWGAA